MVLRYLSVSLFFSMILGACVASESTDLDTGTEASEVVGSTLPEEAGCESTVLYERSSDPGEPGPWPVGARTVDVDGLTGEIWYPAVIGSDADQEIEVYDETGTNVALAGRPSK